MVAGRLAPACLNCYVYRIDAKHGKDSSVATITTNFSLPIRKNRAKQYRLTGDDIVYTCFTSDFLLEDADTWWTEAWQMIKERSDLKIMFITKRIDRFHVNLLEDWVDGYDNVAVGCTCENQDRADYRLPIFLSLPIKHHYIICEPLLEKIDLSKYLSNEIDGVVVGDESGSDARLCDYGWILNIREQFKVRGAPFTFKQTGAKFKVNRKTYFIKRNTTTLKPEKRISIYSVIMG